MDYQLQVITLPVSDVDKAAAFYTQQAGFTLDVDYHPAPGFRVVQLTPPGSACSIQIGAGLTDAPPGCVPARSTTPRWSPRRPRSSRSSSTPPVTYRSHTMTPITYHSTDVQLLDTGHLALETHAGEIATAIRTFLAGQQL